MNNKQNGMSMILILIIVAGAASLIMAAVRIVPSYYEYSLIKEVVKSVATDNKLEGESIGEVRRRLDTDFNTNQIRALAPRDIEVIRKNGKIFINANYEDRIHITGMLYAVMVYDDLEIAVEN